MNLSKKHKTYYRAKDGSIRNLQKASPALRDFLLDYFFNKGGNKKYQDLNKDVKHYSNLKPIDLVVPKHLQSEFDKLTKEKSIVITYNSTWRPAAKLFRI